jgi:hypothetical protein
MTGGAGDLVGRRGRERRAGGARRIVVVIDVAVPSLVAFSGGVVLGGTRGTIPGRGKPDDNPMKEL